MNTVVEKAPARKRSVFEKRVAFKPFEYPELVKYKEAIQHSYWLVSEWNFQSDVHDFYVKLNDVERSAIKNTLLAISQIEVSVKRFWAKLGERFPKAEFDQVGVVCAESECFDDQTEILTNKGWKYFKNLDNSEKVAQFDINNHIITFVKPVSYIAKHYEGLIHHYYSQGTDLMVTPNHEILTMHPISDKYIKKASCEGIWAGNYRYPIAGKAQCENPIVFSELDRLLISIQADGSLYGCTPSGIGRRDFCFNLKKTRKIDRLEKILRNLNIEYTKSTRTNGFIAINASLPDNIDVTNIKNFGYIDIERVDYEYSRNFIKEIAQWDSNVKNDSITYYNSNLEAIDKVQAISLLGGFSTNKGINRTEEQSLLGLNPNGTQRLTSKTCYALYICDSDKKTYPKRVELPYDGMVYCVEVPSGAIVTRRNKRVAISGNCRHADAYSHLLQVLNINNDFTTLLEIPAIQGRVDYLTKYLKDANNTDNQKYSLTLSLFSIFIENVSLFSQFAIIKSFNKYKNVLKDIDNVVSATMKEEMIHALLGIQIINYIREEHPGWFNEEFYDKIYKASRKALKAESNIIDWIFANGELDFLSSETLKEFIKDRLNESVEMIGGDRIFDVDNDKIKNLEWFNEEILAESNTDFFHKRPVTYSKFTKSFQEEDLF